MSQKQKNHFLYTLFALGACFMLFAPLVFAADNITDTTAVDTEKQENIDSTQDDIAKVQDKLQSAQKKQAAIQGDLNVVQGELSQKQAAINKVAGVLADTQETIDRKSSEIDSMEKRLALHKAVLRDLMQELYYVREIPLLEIILDEDEVQDVLNQGEGLFTTQERITNLLAEINDTKAKIASEKEALAETVDDQEALLAEHQLEKQDILSDRNEVLAELDSQANVVAKLNKELAQLQGDLQVLTGKSYSASNIKEAVNFASKQTGVPKGFLYGMLKMETNLGRNVGGCTYAEVEDGAKKNYKNGNLSKRAWTTFQNRRDVFKSITDELDLDYRKQKVSCNPSGYAGTGGAMGVAQFMPDTWVGYKAEVAKMTGHKPPSPWDLTDGVMAMALKLRRTPGVTDGSTSAMKRAACSYLGTCYAPYVNGILYWAENYKQLI